MTGTPARAMSKDEAYSELRQLEAEGLILLEGHPTPDSVSLDGWNPVDQTKQDGNVAGVVIRYWSSGTKQYGGPSGGAAPDNLDPRNALALVRLCQWLVEYYSVTELYHLGISGGGVDANGNPRRDCHGQGRAVDLVGVRGPAWDGGEFVFTVTDEWGSVSTSVTPGGAWPPGTASNVTYRLDDPSEPPAREFFQSLYGFVASQWQDRSDGPDGEDSTTSIGEHSYVMHPDHPASAPGTAHGREAHADHIHMQIGVTGTEY